MHEDDAPPARPGSSLVGALAAALGAVAMGASISTLRESAASAPPQDVLIAWVLLGTAVVGAVLCAYLALIWTLATVILLAGPASGLGTALLGPLRLLAPRLARRTVTGASVATAATALAMTSSLAAPGAATSAPLQEGTAAPQTATLFSSELPSPEPDPEGPTPDEDGAGGAAPDGGQQAPAEPGTSGAPGTGDPSQLPSLGWDDGAHRTDQGGDPAAESAAPGTQQESVPATGPSSTGASTSAPPSAPDTVVVRSGDSLWSITGDLLGPNSGPDEIAEAWPHLHDANKRTIGEDPDLLQPGQILTVPSDLTTEDQS